MAVRHIGFIFHGNGHSKSNFLRLCFFWAKLFFRCKRFSMADFEGFVGLLFLATLSAISRISSSRIMASCLFLCWLLLSSHWIINTFSLVKRLPNFSEIRSFSNAERAFDANTLNAISIFDETLFTCCPPAPPLLMALNCSSFNNWALFMV